MFVHFIQSQTVYVLTTHFNQAANGKIWYVQLNWCFHLFSLNHVEYFVISAIIWAYC